MPLDLALTLGILAGLAIACYLFHELGRQTGVKAERERWERMLSDLHDRRNVP